MKENNNAELRLFNVNAENKNSLMNVVSGKNKQIELLLTPDNERDCLEMEDASDPNNHYVLADENGNSIPQKYDALRVTYKDMYVVVEVNDVYTELIVDDNDEPIVLKEFGDEYLAENIVYELGKVLETNIESIKEANGSVPSMKCLAVRQPWAQLIVAGIKDIECREAMPAPKKPKVFIAASGTKLDWNDLSPEVQKIYGEYEKQGVLPAYNDLPTKCIVGYVDIVKASFDPVDSEWGRDWDGMKYTLRNAMVLDEPIVGKNKATPYFYNVEGFDENHLPAAHKAL